MVVIAVVLARVVLPLARGVDCGECLQGHNKSFVTPPVDSALAGKHDSLALHHTPELTPQTNKTAGKSPLSGNYTGPYLADEASDPISGYVKDLDTRFERNDEVLLSAYANMLVVGVNDKPTLDTIVALQESNKRIQSAILEVIYENLACILPVYFPYLTCIITRYITLVLPVSIPYLTCI